MHIPLGLPRIEDLALAAANVYDRVAKGKLADLRPLPASIIHEEPQCTVFRYLPLGDERRDGPSVLFVPPLAGSSLCFDLRRGHSLAEHLVRQGKRTFLVDYGSIGFSERGLGLEHWVRTVLPDAIRAASEACGGARVHAIGWSLGGLLLLLASAASSRLPIASITAVGSPIDTRRVPIGLPMRPLGVVADGALMSWTYRTMGIAPEPLLKRGFQLTSIDRTLMRPLWTMLHLHERDLLAQAEAVDRFNDNFAAYPGRTVGQIYHRLFRLNELAEGEMQLDGKRINLGAITAPVLAVAGRSDVLAPLASVEPIRSLLTGAEEVCLEVSPGGHLGVLTGLHAPETTWAFIDRHIANYDMPASQKKSRRSKVRRSSDSQRRGAGNAGTSRPDGRRKA